MLMLIAREIQFERIMSTFVDVRCPYFEFIWKSNTERSGQSKVFMICPPAPAILRYPQATT